MGGVTGGIVKELSACLNFSQSFQVECLPQCLNLKALSEIAFEGGVDFQIGILLISENY